MRECHCLQWVLKVRALRGTDNNVYLGFDSSRSLTLSSRSPGGWS